MRRSEMKRDEATGGSIHQGTIKKYHDVVNIPKLQKMQLAYRRAYISLKFYLLNYLNYKYECILNKIALVASIYSFGSVTQGIWRKHV